MEITKPTLPGIYLTPCARRNEPWGSTLEAVNRNDPNFKAFGELYFSEVNPGVVKGWHWHEKTELNYFVLWGTIRFVFIDAGADGAACDRWETSISAESGLSLKVPPRLWYAFKGCADTPSLLANCSSHPHDPSESKKKDLSEFKF